MILGSIIIACLVWWKWPDITEFLDISGERQRTREEKYLKTIIRFEEKTLKRDRSVWKFTNTFWGDWEIGWINKLGYPRYVKNDLKERIEIYDTEQEFLEEMVLLMMVDLQ